ncbi:hypothetical protein Tco_0140831 [Tanacetum coccineum]
MVSMGGGCGGVVDGVEGTLDRGCGYFKWMDSPSGSSTPPSSFPRSSTPPSYSPGTSTRPSFSPGSSRSAQNLGKAECSNCKFLAEKIKTLEARIRILEGQLEMERHPENHTLESAAILHEIYNGMGNLNMEKLSSLLLSYGKWAALETNDGMGTPSSQSGWKTSWAKKDDKEDQCASRVEDSSNTNQCAVDGDLRFILKVGSSFCNLK